MLLEVLDGLAGLAQQEMNCTLLGQDICSLSLIANFSQQVLVNALALQQFLFVLIAKIKWIVLLLHDRLVHDPLLSGCGIRLCTPEVANLPDHLVQCTSFIKIRFGTPAS